MRVRVTGYGLPDLSGTFPAAETRRHRPRSPGSGRCSRVTAKERQQTQKKTRVDAFRLRSVNYYYRFSAFVWPAFTSVQTNIFHLKLSSGRFARRHVDGQPFKIPNGKISIDLEFSLFILRHLNVWRFCHAKCVLRTIFLHSSRNENKY